MVDIHCGDVITLGALHGVLRVGDFERGPAPQPVAVLRQAELIPRGIAALLTVEAVGVVVSTVYTQNHYGIDSLTGIAWAFSIQFIVVPALAYLLGPARPAVAAPELAPAYQTFDSVGGA